MHVRQRPMSDCVKGHIAALPVVPPAVAFSGMNDAAESQTCHGPALSTILILGNVARDRAILRAILQHGGEDRRILEAGSPGEALSLIAVQPVDLVVVDLAMPRLRVVDFCSRLKSRRVTRFIQILLLARSAGGESQSAWLESGVDEVLVKPAMPRVVRARVRVMLRHKALLDSLEEAEIILFALAQAVEWRDTNTGQHCQRLAGYSMALGRRLGLSGVDLRSLYQGGYLHDIGKISVPDAILFKPGPLNDAEWEIMRGHTVAGEAICRGMKSLAGVLPIIRCHHERWDGSGYPDGLSGRDIPILARVLQVADIYDALMSRRPYKAAMEHREALLVLQEEARRGWRDAELVHAFSEITVGELAEAAQGVDPALDLTRLEESVSEWSSTPGEDLAVESLPEPLRAAQMS